MRSLSKGQPVRCRNAENDLVGVVVLASDSHPEQSVAVFLGNDLEGIRINGRIAITNMLPLTINYETHTVMDLFGNEWEIYVAEEGQSVSSDT